MFEDAIGLPIFQFPSANISNKTRISEGIDPAVLLADHVLRVLGLEGSVQELMNGWMHIHRVVHLTWWALPSRGGAHHVPAVRQPDRSGP